MISATIAAPAGTGERILLADDNADMREYIRRLLVGKGYAVETVADGAGGARRGAARAAAISFSPT